ncbi:MAG: chemotaxis protein CheB [Ramlibacter sp.]|nr:chemotaxis protein CheB [Ramlibacter sp.]
MDGNHLRLSRAAKENHVRPAADPLFRTAAATLRGNVIGVVLTGQMDDGSAGLDAVKQCGGIAVVQDPRTAEAASMPRSALRRVRVDHCVSLEQLPGLLERLVREFAPRAAEIPQQVLREALINLGSDGMEHLGALGTPSGLTCPDCGGGLWELKDDKLLRYRCHTGHAYSPMSLANAQVEKAEEKLWASVRALQEKQMLLRRVAEAAEQGGDPVPAAQARAAADQLEQRIQALRALAEQRGEDDDPPQAPEEPGV